MIHGPPLPHALEMVEARAVANGSAQQTDDRRVPHGLSQVIMDSIRESHRQKIPSVTRVTSSSLISKSSGFFSIGFTLPPPCSRPNSVHLPPHPPEPGDRVLPLFSLFLSNDHHPGTGAPAFLGDWYLRL
ncbi:uncharacterized protein LOC110825456 isoform X2 [Carica papaya]|uniref:uncharacterized protein LOC110825456 isoform X2 n=1 Tax=Carica papaya TaxID=3649 RepID=UPI000B8D0ECC|nr:uncharacterized protein LOC110825456 isoform X2 [Carica papaya]